MQRGNIICTYICTIRVNPPHFIGTNLAGDLAGGWKDGATTLTYNIFWRVSARRRKMT